MTYEVFDHISRHAKSSYLQYIDLPSFYRKIYTMQSSQYRSICHSYVQTRSSAHGGTRETLPGQLYLMKAANCKMCSTSCANLVSPWCWHTSFSQTDYCIRNLFCGRNSRNVSTNKKLSIWWDTGNAIVANISWWKQDTVTEICTAKTNRFLMKRNCCSKPIRLVTRRCRVATIVGLCLLIFRLVEVVSLLRAQAWHRWKLLFYRRYGSRSSKRLSL